MDKRKRIGITILSLIGLALSIELCIVFYKANWDTNRQKKIRLLLTRNYLKDN